MPTAGRVVFSAVVNCSVSTPATNSTTPYDAEGAMKFTVAVVLVFGVGVIGMLGMYHHRNISEELSDKEADDFVKRFDRKRCNLDKQYRKEVMRSWWPPSSPQHCGLPECSSLLSDFPPPADSGPQCRDTQSASRDHPAHLAPPDPAIEPRSRSRSFHVPDARLFGPSRKAMLNSRKPLLPIKGSTDSESRPLLCPDPKAGPSSDWWGAGDCARPLPNGQNRVDSGDGEGQDCPPSDFTVCMGGRLVVPRIVISDVHVT
ncbi:hypothetical protein ACOMHN_000813 [Nucella lapillus]